jgi:hypothetical protein
VKKAEMSISVPHQFVDASPVQPASSSYMDVMKRSFEMAGERIGTVVEIEALRNKRRDVGYMAEDGTTKLRGSSKDTDALYGEAWVADFVARHTQLDASPHMNFVRILTGMSNSARQTFIDESLVNRATAARIEAAQRLVKDLIARQTERDTTGSSISEQALLLTAANESLRALQLQLMAIQFAQKEFIDLVDSESTKEMATQILNPPAELFPQLVYRLVALGWPDWLKEAPERLIQVITAAINNAGAVENPAMPLIGRVVFFVKALEASADKVSIKTAMLENKLVNFRPGCEYNTDPYLYYRDLALLSPLFAPGTNSITLFSEISLVLYAHLNKMRRRAGLEDDMELDRPLRKKAQAAARGQPRTRNIDGEDVVFDLGDDALEYMADDENIGLYTKEQLAAARSKLATNTDPKRTLVLVEALLQPFVFAFLPLAFFTIPEDEVTINAGLAGKGSIVTTLEGAEAVPSITWILEKTLAAFAQNAAVRALLSTAVTDTLFVSDTQSRRYQSWAIEALTVETKVLSAFAACAVAFADAERPLAGVTPRKLAALRKFLENPSAGAKEAYEVFTRSLLTRRSDEANYAPILSTSSAQTFYVLIKSADSAPLESRISAAKTRADQQQALYDTLLQQRSQRIEAGKQEVVMTLQQALTDNYVPTAGVALSPMNSGLIFYTDVTIAAMSAAHDMLSLYVPCLIRQYATSDALIVSDAYCQAFAGLVNSQVRLADVRNPTSYRQTVHETRARNQAVSALNNIRMICGQDRSIRHVQGCTCLFRS